MNCVSGNQSFLPPGADLGSLCRPAFGVSRRPRSRDPAPALETAPPPAAPRPPTLPPPPGSSPPAPYWTRPALETRRCPPTESNPT